MVLLALRHIGLAAVRATAFAAYQEFAEGVFPTVPAKFRFGLRGGLFLAGAPRDLLLDLLEGDPVNNRRMAVVYIVFGELSLVLHAFAGEDVLHIRLLQERVADVLLVPEHMLHRAVRPFFTAAHGPDTVRFQIPADLSDAVPHEVAGEDAPDDGSLRFVNLRLAVGAFFVSQEAVIVIIYFPVFVVVSLW